MASANDGLPAVDNNVETLKDNINGSADSSSEESKFLLCSQCLHRYSKPKLLPCLHTFCQNCIDGCTPPQSLSISCPTCRQQSILPADGIAEIHDNAFVAQLSALIEQRLQCTACVNDVSKSCDKHADKYGGAELATLKMVR